MPDRSKKVVVVRPGYNAERTLQGTLDAIPRDWVDEIVLVDDRSRDRTVEIARRYLEAVKFELNSDDCVFDSEIIAQAGQAFKWKNAGL